MRVPWRNDPAWSTIAELWFISSLTPAWYGTRAKHPCRVARPGKPRPRDRIAYNSSTPWSTVPFTVNSTFHPVSLPLFSPSCALRLSVSLSPSLYPRCFLPFSSRYSVSMFLHVRSRVSVSVHAWHTHTRVVLCARKLFRSSATESGAVQRC